MEDFDTGQAEDATVRLSAGSTGVPETHAAQMAQSELLTPGGLFLGKYSIQDRIGSGGMGVVYRCNQVFIGKDMAIKTLNQSSMSDEAVQRFQTEAKAAGSLSHPNLVSVYDFGVTEGGTPYMVMDFVPGKTLQDVLFAHGQIALETVLDIFIQCADGLAHAHENGVYHRDIKPSNIVLLQEENVGPGSIRILDFGIAKIAANSSQTQELTKTGMVIGSPLYMSPEQSIGKRVDARTDIYSLGCVLFECLCGAPPFQGDTVIETLMLHQTEAPKTLREASLGREFPPRLQELVSAMMAKIADDRIDSMRSVCQELARIRDSISGSDKKMTAEKESKSPKGQKVPKVGGQMLSVARSKLFSTPVIIFAVVLLVGCISASMISQLLIQPKPVPKIELADGAVSTPGQEQAGYDYKVKKALTEARSRGQDFVHVPACEFSQNQFELLGSQKWIRRLELYECTRFTPLGFDTLLQPNIEELDLLKSTLSDDCFAAIARCKSLRVLSLARCKGISPTGLMKIAGMKNLVSLDMAEVPVSDEVLKVWVENMHKCGELKVSRNNLIGDNSLRIIGKHKAKRYALDVANTSISDQGLKYLGKNLVSIYLTGNPRITDRGIETLIKNCPDLEVIQMPGTSATVNGIMKLTKLKNLHDLELGKLAIDETTRNRIRKAFKDRKVNTYQF